MHAHTHTNTYLHKPMHSDTLTEFPYILIVYGYGSCCMIYINWKKKRLKKTLVLHTWLRYPIKLMQITML